MYAQIWRIMMTATDLKTDLLRPYQVASEKAIQRHIDKLDSNNRLSAAYAYALTNGGKRFRPAVVFMVAEALNSPYDVSYAALAVELCHTASLIADDLPIMDDDDIRRAKPSLHRAFSESTALLTSYAMIADAYASLALNARVLEKANCKLSHEICVLAIENAAHNTGIAGATGGQYLDLNPPDLTEKTLLEIIEKKTVALFEIAFVLGWLYGGGPLDRLPLVKQASRHFGIAFQVADDLEDIQQDQLHPHLVNYAGSCGLNTAKELLYHEINNYRKTLDKLSITSPQLLELSLLIERDSCS